jgi:hypothetical protein
MAWWMANRWASPCSTIRRIHGIQLIGMRGYGLFAANIFGLRDFENDKSKDGSLTLAPGETLRFRYRVVIHPGDVRSAHIALYEDYYTRR